jgi:hypothetical protein
MNDLEFEPFEAELRSLSPARPPAELMERLVAARPLSSTGPRTQTDAPRANAGRDSSVSGLSWLLGWLMPAGAVGALVIGGLVLLTRPATDSLTTASSEGRNPGRSERPEKSVEINRELLASYDAIAQLASGEPVRFHCREWDEKVVFRDPARGIAVERRIPRVEVTPVSLETY